MAAISPRAVAWRGTRTTPRRRALPLSFIGVFINGALLCAALFVALPSASAAEDEISGAAAPTVAQAAVNGIESDSPTQRDPLPHWQRQASWILSITLLGALLVIGLTARHVRSVNIALREEIATREENQRIRDQLETRMSEVERMKSLGQLAGGVAHDLNNLLTSVICDAETLLMQAPSDTMVSLRSIIRSAESAAELSRVMLTYSGKTVVVKTVRDVNDVIAHLLPLLRAGVRSRIQLQYEPSVDPAFAEIDSTAIDQILLNLIANATDAIADDGTIVVSTGMEKINRVNVDPQLHGDRAIGGDFVYVEVADNGAGIEDDFSAKIFEPFFTTRSQGRGLGLAVVYGHVNRHNGLIRLVSGSAGTRVRILLPEAKEGAKQAGVLSVETDEPSFESNLSGVHVLVVDDEPDVLNSITRLLAARGCEVEMARDGREAIEILGQRAPEFDLVITDLVMPNCDGHTLVTWMLRQMSGLPVVVMSGFSERDISQYNKMDNVVETIEKPFSPKSLCRAVEMGVRPVQQ